MYDISYHVTTAKSSTGNSPVKRLHSTITEIIKIIYDSNKNKSIGEIMDEAIITYNSSIHSTTKLTPFELISGHYNKQDPFPKRTNIQTEHDYLRQHIDNYDILCKLVHERSLNYKKKTIDRLNKDRNDPPNFDPEQIIYEADNRRTKVAPKFIKQSRN